MSWLRSKYLKMLPVEIKKDVYWVGAVDWDLRNFHGYLTQRGSTYNSYLIIDEKVTLVDTVKEHLFDEMLERISQVIDPAKIDYIISNHVEMDHSGGLPQIIKIAKNAKIITSPNGKKGLQKHFRQEWNFQVVSSGDSICIGSKTLKFLLTPMVHWPDSMVTCLVQEKILFSNDAFGQHIASVQRFDKQFDFGILEEEAKKYYANIVLPYGVQVKKALDEVLKMDIEIVAPSHGIIWQKYLKQIVNLYQKWADNYTENKAVIIYDTMWHSTENIAKAIKNGFEQSDISAVMLNLQTNHISDVMKELLTAKYICVGSSTLNNGLLPKVAAFLSYMKGLAPKNRTGLSFGSYGWGGQSIELINEVLTDCGFTIMEPIKVQYLPDEQTLTDISKSVKGGLR